MTNLYVFVNLGDLLNHIVGIGEVEKRNRKLKDIHIIPTEGGDYVNIFYSNPFSNNCCVTLGKMLNFSETTLSHTV